MIVTSGKDVIKNYFGGQIPQIGDHLAFGTGTTAADLTDTALGTEVYRVPVTSISADLANSRIVFKATIAPGYITSFSEVGLFYVGGTADATLVCRNVLSVAQTVDANLPTDVEYSLVISV